MVFIIGGTNQGTIEYADMLSEGNGLVVDVKEFLQKNYEEIYDDSLKEIKEIVNVQWEKIQAIIEDAKIEAAGKKDTALIFVGTEMGCGVIPIEKKERLFVELNGRINCLIAKEANQVIRMVSGIPNIIKNAIKVNLVRHGKTKGNLEGRYVGRTDEGILDSEKERLKEYVNENTQKVYISPMLRCKETAEILFPNAEKVIVENLKECDFGLYEYRNFEELSNEKAYQDYIDSYGKSAFPEGESLEEFSKRILDGFETVLRLAKEKNETEITVVAHGGTIMAIMDKYIVPHKEYFEWMVKNGSGYTIWLNEQNIGTLHSVYPGSCLG